MSELFNMPLTSKSNSGSIYDTGGELVAAGFARNIEQTEARAAHIVLCVNAFDLLVSTAKAWASECSWCHGARQLGGIVCYDCEDVRELLDGIDDDAAKGEAT